MYLTSGLHGQGTSCVARRQRRADGVHAGTNGSSLPSTSSAARPMRVMIFILTATYGESVICTPNWARSEPSGPMLNGITYIVRPGHAAVEQPVQDRLHLGRVHPVVGRSGVVGDARADEGAILDAGDVARVGAGEEAVGPLARFSRMNVPASTICWQSRSYSSCEPSHQCTACRFAELDRLCNPLLRVVRAVRTQERPSRTP